MRPIYTLPLSALLACGTSAPPRDPTTTGTTDSSDTGGTTDVTEPTPPPTTTGKTSTSDDTPFIDKPDGLLSQFECDVFTQDCDPGQKCAFWVGEGGGFALEATRCVPITGDGAPGEPCTADDGGFSGIDDCALAVMCWDVDAENHGVCFALCTGSPDAPECPSGSSCSVSSSVFNLCIPNCDPLLQDCPDDDLCIPAGDKFTCVLDASGEMGAVNDPCEFANACDKGLSCINTASASEACQQGSQGCCQPFCKLPDAPCPNPDQECLPWFDPMMPVPPGYENVGFCGIPE